MLKSCKRAKIRMNVRSLALRGSTDVVRSRSRRSTSSERVRTQRPIARS
jgi:hypothetical protein